MIVSKNMILIRDFFVKLRKKYFKLNKDSSDFCFTEKNIFNIYLSTFKNKFLHLHITLLFNFKLKRDKSKIK